MDLHRLGPNGESAKGAFHASLNPDVVAAAIGTAKSLARLLNAEGHTTSLENLADVAVANETKRLIQ